MHLNQLRVFCAVVEAKSFSQAARGLHLTQPAVSMQVRSLEEDLGAELFERNYRGIALTPVGKLVYEHAKEILAICESMHGAIDSILQRENAQLIVGASHTVGNYALPCSIWTFKQRHPESHIRLEIASSADVLRRVLDNTVDLGIVEGPVMADDVKIREISSDELVVIAPVAPPWLTRETISLKELKKEPIILREEGSGIREALQVILAGAGITLPDLNVVAEMQSNDAIKSAVESGLGLSIISRLTVQREIRRGLLKAIYIDGVPSEIKFSLLYRPQRYQTALAKRFIRFLTSPEERGFC